MMSEEDRQFRIAAENLLSGSVQSQRSSYTQRSISSINRDYIVSEDLIAGSRYNGRMSPVRRFFCLLVTFDLLFTCLMWLICTTIAGENISMAFVQQVLHYHIQTSLFDIVMLAACRFTILLLFYGLLYLSHWWSIALTTATTSAFLGAKVYFFNWSGVTQPGFQALLIITSFVLAWGETWFFDSRVVPQETQAQEWIRSAVDSERAPLLRHVFDGPPSRMAESIGNFFTPLDSPTHSDDDEPRFRKRDVRSDDDFSTRISVMHALTPEQIAEYKRKAGSILEEAHHLLMSNDWKTITTTPEGDVISALNCSYGKIMRIEGLVDAPASQLLNTLFERVEDLPSWNEEVTDAKKIQTIDEDTDIVYQSTKSFGGGLVGARDFITLRHRGQCGDYFISSGVAANSEFPHRKNYIRGENGIVCWVTQRLANSTSAEGNNCKFIWILNTNLKGWLPQRVIDNALNSTMINFMSSLRAHVEDLSPTFW